MNSAPDQGGHSPQFHAPITVPPGEPFAEHRPSAISGHAEPHFHRCARCRERMVHACVDVSCAEGYQWVIVCFLCYERWDATVKGDW